MAKSTNQFSPAPRTATATAEIPVKSSSMLIYGIIGGLALLYFLTKKKN